jgi:hypothetical protein
LRARECPCSGGFRLIARCAVFALYTHRDIGINLLISLVVLTAAGCRDWGSIWPKRAKCVGKALDTHKD